ncbi:MAG: hypothetical protein ABW199_12410 [Caulobacterales bacterium]
MRPAIRDLAFKRRGVRYHCYMVRFFVIAALFALSSCGQHTRSAETCARSATHGVRFSNAETDDIVTATSAGPSCAQAFVFLSIRDADGDPLWAQAGTYYDMTAGGVPLGDAPQATPQQMDEFLRGWANVRTARTMSLPDWTEGAASLTESATDGMSYDTPFVRETYRALRERDLRMLCFANSPESEQCLIIDPASNAPTVIVFHGA